MGISDLTIHTHLKLNNL